MTYIVYDDLTSTLEQDLISTCEQYIGGIDLNLLKCLEPAGTFTVSIRDSWGATLGSKSYTIEQMKALGSDNLSADYFHGFIHFEFESPILLGIGTYYVVLTATDYSYNNTEYIGWLRDWSNKLVYNVDDAPYSVNEPFSYRAYTWKR
jgi:hypothetical protein